LEASGGRPGARVFVALGLPGVARSALAEQLARWALLAPAFRWVPAENLHLTLRFVGRVESAELDLLRDRLRRVRHPRFELALGRLGTFGGRTPRVVWLGLERGGPEAASLSRAVEAACGAAGLAPEARRFQPHVTLARSRERTGARLTELTEPPALAAWTAGEFLLYESRPRPGPPVSTAPERFLPGG